MIKRHYRFDKKKWFNPLYIHEKNTLEKNRALVNLKLTKEGRYFVRVKVFHHFEGADFVLPQTPKANDPVFQGNRLTLKPKANSTSELKTVKKRKNQKVLEIYLLLDVKKETRHFTIEFDYDNNVECHFTIPGLIVPPLPGEGKDDPYKRKPESALLSDICNSHQLLIEYNKPKKINNDLFYEGDSKHEHIYHHMEVRENNKIRFRFFIFHTFERIKYDQPFTPLEPVDTLQYEELVLSDFNSSLSNIDQQAVYLKFKIGQRVSKVFQFKLENEQNLGIPQKDESSGFIDEYCDVIIPPR